MLQKGAPTPQNLPLVDEAGKTFTLADLRGSYVVVYFYPKDMTPGCTLEAEQFRDYAATFEKLNTRILGVSKDSCASHIKFKEKKALTYTLVADVGHELMEAFGVWGERKFMGRTYMGTSRSTFLIDPAGIVLQVWEKVTPAGHAEEVLQVIQDVQKNA